MSTPGPPGWEPTPRRPTPGWAQPPAAASPGPVAPPREPPRAQEPAAQPPRRPRRSGARSSIASTRLILVIAAVALLLAGAAAWAGLAAPVVPPDTQLEAAGIPGPSPFSAPLGTDRTDLVQPADPSGHVTGDLPALYAREGDTPACDVSALTAALAADPGRAAGWAGALGIPAEQAGRYASGLTPVLLRSDTGVTTYAVGGDGVVSDYPAVLQAGSAVLVDNLGVPRVRCASGNPLGPGNEPTGAGYSGEAWRFFRQATVVYVDSAPAPLAELTVLDLTRGELTRLSVG